MSSFISALAALRAHQSWIDVIGDNLANQNTPGFKRSRALFADLVSVTKKPATPATGNLGGTNPLQFGLGVQLASVDKRLDQGALDLTGRTFDLGMLGRGFFALQDGSRTVYSRVGAFGLDSNGDMVDLRSGYRVMDSSGAPFSIDTGAVFPPSQTTQVDFSGNLPAEVSGPLAEELSSSSSFNEGTAALMTGGASQPFAIPAGETWTMELTLNGGAPQQVAIQGTGVPLTAQEIVDEINGQTEDVVAAVGVGNTIQLTSQRSGTKSTLQATAGSAGRDLKGLLGLGDFVQGTETPATAGSDLSSLTSNLVAYQIGDQIEVTGTDVDGSPVVASFTYGVDGTTVGELTSFLDTQFTQATASFDDTTGQIVMTANQTGEASLSLTLSDVPAANPKTDWTANFFAVTTNGTGADTVTTSAEVFDPAGTARVLTFDYTRQDDGSWNLDVSIPPSEGTVISGTIAGITFNPDGSIATPTSGQIQVQFLGQGTQNLDIDLGTSGQFDGLTQFGNPPSVIADFQDGFGAGELSNILVQSDGAIDGFYTNGQVQTLGSFGVATFANEEALEDIGDSYFVENANTGARVLGSGQANGAGEMVGGALETSNVDTAEEFVRLIEAQRGFQANARVVTVQDELLAEIVNVV